MNRITITVLLIFSICIIFHYFINFVGFDNSAFVTNFFFRDHGLKKNYRLVFYIIGTVLEHKEGVRVEAIAFRKDSKFILAADTHHRIRAYNLEEDQTDYTVLQETHGIMSFTLDDSDRYALLNIANQVS